LYPQLMFLGQVTTVRPMFSLELQTFLDMGPNLLSFALVVCFLTYLLYKPVKKMLEDRAERVIGELNDATSSRQAADDLKLKYEQLVAGIESERSSVMEEARKIAKDRQNQLIDDAKAEAAEIRERAVREIAVEKERIKGSVFEAIVDISTTMAEHLITTKIDKSAHDRLFSEAMEELEATAFNVDSILTKKTDGKAVAGSASK